MTLFAPTAAEPPKTRIAALDAARGLAIVAMVIYHFCWDIDFFGLVAWNIDDGTGWKVFRVLIAGSFLFLVGVGLVLAHHAGFRREVFWRRLAFIAMGALAVSLATAIVIPQSFVFFGILHAIAVYSVFGLAFLRLRWWFCLAVAVLIFVVDAVVALEFMAWPGLSWIGLGWPPPDTVDFEPVFPWFAPVLMGMAFAKLGLPELLRTWPATGPAGRALRWSGRNSLLIYLVHQPVLFGGLWLLVAVFGLGPSERDRFVAQCEASCSPADFGDACPAFCQCLGDEAQAIGVLGVANYAALDADRRVLFDMALQTCRSEAISGANPQ
ncbi:MAG: heparan-alpha-glucosaminide N-acetyltransferase [Azospirillaceae bacterium]